VRCGLRVVELVMELQKLLVLATCRVARDGEESAEVRFGPIAALSLPLFFSRHLFASKVFTINFLIRTIFTIEIGR
jgi:hypothetical protein